MSAWASERKGTRMVLGPQSDTSREQKKALKRYVRCHSDASAIGVVVRVTRVTMQLMVGPGIAGMQFSPLKCVERHEITLIRIMNQKKVKYSTKSATRTFLPVWRKFGSGLGGPNVSRFSSRMDTQLCRDVEGDCWSVFVWLVFPKHALGARELRKTSEFSDR